ncbi:uncharacterized protein TNCV_3204151 [Trichonephila clavipes]|nr:uncharacterized protein TNCV_3204151 [Trichonephila clavipes]
MKGSTPQLAQHSSHPNHVKNAKHHSLHAPHRRLVQIWDGGLFLQSRSPKKQRLFNIKLFTSALKASQCNNRIVMAQKKHLDDFLLGRIIGRLECELILLEVSEELESPTVSSPGFGNDSKIMVM